LAGALRARREENLGSRRVRILLEKMMLDFPGVVDAEPVCEFDLIERLLKQPDLVALVPRPRQLMLVENPEFHGRSTYCLSMIFSENRYPPRIKCGAGFFGSCSKSLVGEIVQPCGEGGKRLLTRR